MFGSGRNASLVTPELHMTNKTVLAPHKSLSVVSATELDVLVISIVGIADDRTIGRLYDALRSATGAPTEVVVLDLHLLESTDRASMRVLATEVQAVRNRGIPVALVGLDRPGSDDWPIEDVAIPVQFASVPLAVSAFASTPSDAGDASSPGRGRSKKAGRTPGSTDVLARIGGTVVQRLAGGSEKALQFVGQYTSWPQRTAHPAPGGSTSGSAPAVPVSAEESPRRIETAPSWRAPTPTEPGPE